MIKTSLVPTENKLHIIIPNDYIGKKVEILLYTDEDIIEPMPLAKKTMADFWGKLSNKTADDLHKLTQQGRNEWNDRIEKQS